MTAPYLRELAAGFKAAPPYRPKKVDTQSTLLCPVCGVRMEFERFRGMMLDVCKKHGVWFDLSEVPELVEQVATEQRESAMEAIKDARAKGKVAGMVFGIWSLLFEVE